MKYNLKWLTEQQEKPLKYLFFWGHQPSKDGRITQTCLSQWWVSSFVVDGITYPTAEHWMMAQKAKLFEDDKVFEQILKAASPAEAKKLGRQIQNFDEERWLAQRDQIVVEGNFHKFSQNNALKEFLQQTQRRILAEASPIDTIWGIGLAADNPAIVYPEKWQGSNLLGFALMEVRDRLAD